MEYQVNLIKKLVYKSFSKEIENIRSVNERIQNQEEMIRRNYDMILQGGMFSGHYNIWREKRITAIVSHYGPLWFKQKKILELGAGYGDIGATLSALGAEVTCSEARAEHIEVLKSKHPQINAIQANLESEWPFGKQFDLILHLGLLYHLDDFEFSLKKSLNSAKYIVLETEVCDSDDETKIVKVEENSEGYDQSFVGKGSRPSASYIEKIIEENGCRFARLNDESCNSSFHIYNWKVGNTGTWCHGLRRLWFIENPKV